MDQTQQPAENRMPIGAKIGMIAGSFFLPIAVLLFLMVGSMGSSMEFAEKELAGNAFLRPLMAFQAAAQDYREGGGGEAGARAEAALAALEAEDRKSGALLQFTAEGLRKRGREGMDVAGLRAAWSGFKAAGAPETGSRYEALAAMTRTLITHAGDTSNLILDPDLDSYYLMDAVLVAAPQMQDRLTSIAGAARDGQRDGEAARLKIAVAAAMLEEADFGRLAASTQTAMNEDANFYGPSPSLRPRMEAALAALSNPAKRLLEAMRNGGDARSVASLAAETRVAGVAYWTAASEELDQLLRARVADYAGQRNRAILISGAAVFAASLLAFFLLQSITQPLEKLVRSLGPGATLLSGCVEKIAEVTQQQAPSPEEAGIICEELNAHADDMRKAVLELARQVRGGDAEELASAASGFRAL